LDDLVNAHRIARFWEKVDKNGPLLPGQTTPCWQWTAATDKGYGRFGNWDDPTRSQLAHRLAYELLVGPIAEGMTVDHLCVNTRCVNPDHFEIVTSGANALRGHGPAALNARKDCCVAGHELTEANVYAYKGRRECRTCRREALRAHRARKAHGSQAA
jgi:hypothetical protein